MDNYDYMQYATEYVRDLPTTKWKSLANAAIDEFTSFVRTDDKCALGFIEDNDLKTPQKLACFIVKTQIDRLISTYEDYYSETKKNMEDWKSVFENAQDVLDYALNNPQKKDAEIAVARRQMMKCIRDYETAVLKHIEEIRKLDNQSDVGLFFSSWKTLIRCKKESGYAFEAANMIMNVYQLVAVMDANTHGNPLLLIKHLENVQRKITAGDNCSLMEAYSKQKHQKIFWHNLPMIFDKQKKFIKDSVTVFKGRSMKKPFWDNEVEDVDLSNIF